MIVWFYISAWHGTTFKIGDFICGSCKLLSPVSPQIKICWCDRVFGNTQTSSSLANEIEHKTLLRSVLVHITSSALYSNPLGYNIRTCLHHHIGMGWRHRKGHSVWAPVWMFNVQQQDLSWVTRPLAANLSSLVTCTREPWRWRMFKELENNGNYHHISNC